MNEIVIQEQNCLLCGKDTGTKIVCDDCHVGMNPNQHKKINRIYHRMIIELFNNCCVDCGHSAESDSGELCADHIEQKNTAPMSRYDLACAVCRCHNCHTKRHNGNITKLPSPSKMPKQTQEKANKSKKPAICEEAGCPIYALGSGKKPKKCWKHQ